MNKLIKHIPKRGLPIEASFFMKQTVTKQVLKFNIKLQIDTIIAYIV